VVCKVFLTIVLFFDQVQKKVTPDVTFTRAILLTLEEMDIESLRDLYKSLQPFATLVAMEIDKRVN
jgi:hypothetical protein